MDQHGEEEYFATLEKFQSFTLDFQARKNFFDALHQYERFPDSEPLGDQQYLPRSERFSTQCLVRLERLSKFPNSSKFAVKLQERILFNLLCCYRWFENMKFVRTSNYKIEYELEYNLTAKYFWPPLVADADFSTQENSDYKCRREVYLPHLFVNVGRFDQGNVRWSKFAKKDIPNDLTLAQISASKIRECLLKQASLFEVSTLEVLANLAYTSSLPELLQSQILIQGKFTEDASSLDRKAHLVNSNGCPTLLFFAMRAIGKHLDFVQSNQCRQILLFYLELFDWIFTIIEEEKPKSKIDERNYLPFRQVLRCIFPCDQYP